MIKKAIKIISLTISIVFLTLFVFYIAFLSFIIESKYNGPYYFENNYSLINFLKSKSKYDGYLTYLSDYSDDISDKMVWIPSTGGDPRRRDEICYDLKFSNTSKLDVVVISIYISDYEYLDYNYPGKCKVFKDLYHTTNKYRKYSTPLKWILSYDSCSELVAKDMNKKQSIYQNDYAYTYNNGGLSYDKYITFCFYYFDKTYSENSKLEEEFFITSFINSLYVVYF